MEEQQYICSEKEGGREGKGEGRRAEKDDKPGILKQTLLIRM